MRKLALFFAPAGPFCPKDGSIPKMYYPISHAKPIPFSDTKDGQENESGSGEIGISHMSTVGRNSQL